MTEVTLRLPDDLVEEARAAGLMTEQTVEALLREAIRRQAAERLGAAMARLDALNLPPMSGAEVQAEIDAARCARRDADRR